MTGIPLAGGDRDRAEVQALVADHYLEALLAAGDRRALDAPADATLDEELRDAARVLRRALVRVHPSFRFEERLAARLAEAHPAAVRSLAGAPPAPLAFPDRFPAAAALDPDLAAIVAGELDPAASEAAATVPRPLLVGGAMASAAISLVGVALFAWRTTRPAAGGSPGPMARAARSVHGRRAGAVRGVPIPGAGRPS